MICRRDLSVGCDLDDGTWGTKSKASTAIGSSGTDHFIQVVQ